MFLADLRTGRQGYQAYFLRTSRKYVKKGEIWKSSGHGPVEIANVV
jgi:hypothetical protein